MREKICIYGTSDVYDVRISEQTKRLIAQINTNTNHVIGFTDKSEVGIKISEKGLLFKLVELLVKNPVEDWVKV